MGCYPTQRTLNRTGAKPGNRPGSPEVPTCRALHHFVPIPCAPNPQRLPLDPAHRSAIRKPLGLRRIQVQAVAVVSVRQEPTAFGGTRSVDTAQRRGPAAGRDTYPRCRFQTRFVWLSPRPDAD
jgi:hypothetical protein